MTNSEILHGYRVRLYFSSTAQQFTSATTLEPGCARSIAPRVEEYATMERHQCQNCLYSIDNAFLEEGGQWRALFSKRAVDRGCFFEEGGPLRALFRRGRLSESDF